MRNCQQCGKELKRKQIWNKRKYCSRQCCGKARANHKIEYNGVRLYPGKRLEVLKLCCTGMEPSLACETVGVGDSVLRRLRENPETAALLPQKVCSVCGGNMPLLNRKYCSSKCKWRAKYVRIAAAKGIKPRAIDYESRQKVLELYRDGFDCGSIVKMLNIPKQKVKSWIYHSDIAKEFRPLRRGLEEANTALEWTQILRNCEVKPEHSEKVILVCAALHGSGAPGRYVGIAAEQFWQKDFHDGTCVAFCNILKNAITTIEWRGDNFQMTRIFKTSGTFVWPDEKLGNSIIVTRAEFDRLLSIKKYRKNGVNLDF